MPPKSPRDNFRGFDYDAYLASDHWQALRDEVLIRDEFRCTDCTASGYLEVHHLTYERLGHERLEDLVALCGDCHARVSGAPRRELDNPSFTALWQRQKVYRRIFVEAYGPFPHTCRFCPGPVMPLDHATERRGWPAIHHIDHDHTNNDPANLAAAHVGCHTRHHKLGKPRDEATRRKLRAAQTGKKLSDATRRKMSASQKRRPPPSAEDRAKRSATLKGHEVSPETRAKLRASLTGRKMSPETIAKGIATRKALSSFIYRRVSCVACHREITVTALARHLAACNGMQVKQAKRGPRAGWSPEARANHMAVFVPPMKGKKHTPETRAKMSASSPRRKPSPEHLAAMEAGRAYMYRRVCCTACGREIAVNVLAKHLRTCLKSPQSTLAVHPQFGWLPGANPAGQSSPMGTWSPSNSA